MATGYNYGQLRTLALNCLRLPSVDTQTISIINQEINNAQNDFVLKIITLYKNRIRPFDNIGSYLPGLITIPTPITTNAGQTNYTLNSDVIQIISVTLDGKEVSLIEPDDLWRQEFRPPNMASNSFVTAQRYGETLIISPAQVDGLQLGYKYIRTPNDMSGDSDPPDIPPEHQYRLAYYAAYIATKSEPSMLAEGFTPDYLMDKYMEGLVMQNAT